MRPIRRGPSPIEGNFSDFHDAKPWLMAKLGQYCSYCERQMSTSLAVEHILHKSGYPELEGRWENFLLSCDNCNSTKRTKEVIAGTILLPDRDNTFSALAYTPDGQVKTRAALDLTTRRMAEDLRELVGLNTRLRHGDAGGRITQRKGVWAIAVDAKSDLQISLGNRQVINQIVRSASANGFFSIWMAVFEDYPEMKKRFIDAFPGTRESGCFDPETAAPVSPAPNPDGLPDGGKI
jgi:uncharacterized protein (TIGR02646 family)